MSWSYTFKTACWTFSLMYCDKLKLFSVVICSMRDLKMYWAQNTSLMCILRNNDIYLMYGLWKLLSERDQSWIRRSSRTYVNNKLIISHRLWWQKCSRGKSLIWSTLSVLAVTPISSASVVSVVAVIVIVSLGSSLAFSTPAVGPFEVKLMLLARFGNRTPEDRYILFHIVSSNIKCYIQICSMNWCTSDNTFVAPPHHVHIQTGLQFSHDGFREVWGEALPLWNSAVVT